MSHPIMNKLIPFVVALFLLYIGAKISFFLFQLFSPFIVAFIVASIAQPIKKFLTKHKIPNSISTILSLALILLVLYLILSLIFKLIVTLGALISTNFSDLSTGLVENIKRAITSLSSKFTFLSNYDIPKLLDDTFNKLGSTISANYSTIAGFLLKLVKGLPSKGFFTIIMMIASFYTSFNYEEIVSFIKKYTVKLPLVHNFFATLKSSVFKGVGTWFKAQIILMTITGTILAISFALLKYNNPIMLGYMVGLLDALPVFGLGAVLFPLALYNFVIEKYLVATFLIALYIICVFIRQSIEPKIIGKSIGINPLITLMAIYVGFKMGGFLGLFGLLILMIVIVNYFKEREKKDDLLHRT